LLTSESFRLLNYSRQILQNPVVFISRDVSDGGGDRRIVSGSDSEGSGVPQKKKAGKLDGSSSDEEGQGFPNEARSRSSREGSPMSPARSSPEGSPPGSPARSRSSREGSPE